MMGSADVLGTVPAASVESGIVICIRVSGCSCNGAMPLCDTLLGKHTHSRSSKTGTVRFARSNLSEPFSGCSKKCCMWL